MLSLLRLSRFDACGSEKRVLGSISRPVPAVHVVLGSPLLADMGA